MTDVAPFRFHGIHLHHPDGAQRRNGERSRAVLTVDRRLKSGRVDDIPMSRGDLLKVIEEAAAALRILGQP